MAAHPPGNRRARLAPRPADIGGRRQIRAGGTYLADTTGQRTRITPMDLMPQRFWRTDARSTCRRADSGDTAAVQTFLAQAGVIVHRENSGFAFVRTLPSFADYLAAWIVDAATEYTATTESPPPSAAECPGMLDDQPERDGQDRCHGR